MALDDVVSSVCLEGARFEEATHRTLRWIDRCIAAHRRPHEQALFGIVQGGLDQRLRGRAVQVDPMKPMLKAPGSKRLKL